MSTSRFYLCAIPRAIWVEPILSDGQVLDIVHFVEDALGCENRIPKQVNLDNEFSRYTLCCQRIEQEIEQSGKIVLIEKLGKKFHSIVKSGGFPTQVLDSSYFALLSFAQQHPCPERFGASFYPPDQIGKHKTAFAEWAREFNLSEATQFKQRTAFFEAAEDSDCGVVELQSCFLAPKPSETAVFSASDSSSDEQEPQGVSFVEIPDFVSAGTTLERFEHESKRKLANILRNQILDALRTGEPATFGNQASHDIITEVLNEFVFVPAGESPHPLELRIAYADGSEARPFPLFCLQRLNASDNSPESLNPLRVALMSMRHLELDPEIDFCWFRNRDVSRTRTLAETDQFCYESTLTQLRDSLALGDLVMHLYHTGFEPSVLGFYRGVVQTLMGHRTQGNGNRLIVKPFYYRGKQGYQDGTEWH